MSSVIRQNTTQDIVRINDLLLTVPISTGAHWPQAAPQKVVLQPILISLSIAHDLRTTAFTDDLSHSINYSALYSTITENVPSSTPYCDLDAITTRIIDLIGAEFPDVTSLCLRVVQATPPLHCKTIGKEWKGAGPLTDPLTSERVKYFCEDLECHAIVGINACERVEKQVVCLNICIDWDLSHAKVEELNMGVDFRGLTRALYDGVSRSAYQTIEALASFVALETLRAVFPTPCTHPPFVTVRAAKPYALILASSAEVEITRTFADYPDVFTDKNLLGPLDVRVPSLHKSAIALGSNLGDRFYNIEFALRLLEKPKEVLGLDDQDLIASVVNTSFLYESAPMYVTDQPSFINCACIIETNMTPHMLLRLLKVIEESVGRVPSIRNGPRAVDLDIILYDDVVIDTRAADKRADLENLTGELVIPHPKMAEREFVLRPLYDMIPDYIHPVYHKSIHALLDSILPDPNYPMSKVIPFPRHHSPSNSSHAYIDNVPPTLTHWSFPVGTQNHFKRKTHLMATLNVTPDSFSDGSVHNTMPSALSYVSEAVAAGASIVDIGGYSTRPGAAFVDVQEEIDRVLPVVQAIRESNSASSDVLISVDTFRPEVAESAILAGANCINDVYAFTGPNSYPSVPNDGKNCMAEMKRVARKTAVPVVLMHSRGDAGQNKDYSAYDYARDGAVLEGVRVELGEKVDAIVKGKGGIRRWYVIMDPGVGFSKSVRGNLEVLREGASISVDKPIGPENQGQPRRNPLAGYPLFIGTSRKSFLGAILAQDGGRDTHPKERGWATAAAVACAVQQGALIVRVHDVKEMRDVVRVGSALWNWP